jgi:hypothetical protein
VTPSEIIEMSRSVLMDRVPVEIEIAATSPEADTVLKAKVVRLPRLPKPSDSNSRFPAVSLEQRYRVSRLLRRN